MRMKKVEAYSKDGSIEFTDVHLPVIRVVCPRCNGSGKHVNPSIDGNGLSAEDFAEDPDFAEAYMGGLYDIQCEKCYGENVIDEVDEVKCKTKLEWYKGFLRYCNGIELDNQSRAEHNYELRIGA